MKSVLPALLLLAPVAAAQLPAGWSDVVKEFDAYVASDKVVGASILYMRGGQVIAQHNVGYADRDGKKLVDNDTIFHWGSITKQLTAIGILQLRDERRLTLDDKVTHYVPELRRIHDPYGKIDEITIRMLLNHTAGFQGPTWTYDKGEKWEPFEPTEWSQLVAMMPYQQLLFTPGEKYSYSNPGYVYLGQIIERLTGDPWDGYIYKNIFVPLGLQHSYFRTTPRYLRPYRSHGYYVTKDDKGVETIQDAGIDFDPGITTPNGGWNAPLSDIARFVAFLTAKPASDLVLAHSSIEEMWQPGKPMGKDQWMGLSTFVTKRGDATVLGHTGSQGAYRAAFYFNPATSAAVIYAFNTTAEQSRERTAPLNDHLIDFLSQ